MSTISDQSHAMAELTNHGQWTPTAPYAKARASEIRRLERIVHGRRIQLHITWFKGRIDSIHAVYYPDFTRDDIQYLRGYALPDSLLGLHCGIVSIPLFHTHSAAMADAILDTFLAPGHTAVHHTPGAKLPGQYTPFMGTTIPVPGCTPASTTYYQTLARPGWVHSTSYLYSLTVERRSAKQIREFTALYMVASDTHGYLTPLDEGFGETYATDLQKTMVAHHEDTRLCALLRTCLIPAPSYATLMDMHTILAPMVRDTLEAARK